MRLCVLQIVALVVKYADNIHKSFAASASILISHTLDHFLFQDITVNETFLFGSLLVTLSCSVFFVLSANTSSSHGGLNANVGSISSGGSGIGSSNAVSGSSNEGNIANTALFSPYSNAGVSSNNLSAMLVTKSNTI